MTFSIDYEVLRFLGLKRFVALSTDLYSNCEPLTSNTRAWCLVSNGSAVACMAFALESLRAIVKRKIVLRLGITRH